MHKFKKCMDNLKSLFFLTLNDVRNVGVSVQQDLLKCSKLLFRNRDCLVLR